MSQLSQIFTNIANAIRNKTGSNELITPPQMATAIDNIPSGGSATAYAWKASGGSVMWTNFDVAPETLSDEKELYIEGGAHIIGIYPVILATEEGGVDYSKISDTSFIAFNDTYTRNSAKDFTLWQVSE